MTNTRPLLRRFEIVVYKNKSGADNTQVPAAATVDFYRQGATVSTAVVIPPQAPEDTEVEVYDIGALELQDMLSLGGAAHLRLTGILSSTRILVFNTSSQSISLAVDDRLIPTGNRPIVYLDPLGTVPKPAPQSSVATDSTTGRAQAYVASLRFDYVVTGSGFSGRVFRDAQGGFVQGDLAWINALDYRTLQDAVDAAPADGAVVYVPALPGGAAYDSNSTPSYSPPLRLPHNRAIHLLGDGPFRTYLLSAPADRNLDQIQMRGDYSTVEGLTLLGSSPGLEPGGKGVGIRIWRTGDYDIPHQDDTARNIIYRAAIRDVRIQDSPSWGIYVDDAPRNGLPEFAVWALFDGIEIRENKVDPDTNPATNILGGCVYLGLNGTTTQFFKNCNFKNFSGYGVRVRQAQGTSLIDCIIENSFSEAFGRASEVRPYVSLENCESARIAHCWFEGKTQPGSGTPLGFFIEASGALVRNGIIESCLFGRARGVGAPATTPTNPKAIRIASPARGMVVVNPQININGSPEGGDNHIEIEPGAECIVLGGTLADSDAVGQQIHIKDNAAIDGSKFGMLLGTNLRLRLPRLSSLQQQELLDPKDGDLVYVADPLQTDGYLQIRANGAWRIVKLV